MAALFAVGSALTFSLAVLPRPPETNEVGSYAVGAVALACAVLLRVYSDRLPRGALPWFVGIGSSLISLQLWFSPEGRGGPAADTEMLYLWVVLYAAYFFTRAELAAQLVWIALGYWVFLAFTAPAEMFVARWLTTVVTLGVAAFLLLALRVRVADLVSRLTGAARTDPLTGLHNRRAFEEQIALEVERARRGGRQLSVIVGDLDDFKRFNDRHGHPAGDSALIRIGETLTAGKRQIDSVARTGGEEFALILPDTPAEGAFLVAERLRTAVENDFQGQLVELTLSLGVATFPDHAASPDDLLQAADQAMYAAKQLGRNRSVIFSDQIAAIVSPGVSRHTSSAEMHLSTLLSLAEALDLRDTGSVDHSRTVGTYCELMALELGLPPARVRRVRIAGLLHDIGKIGIADDVLRKAGPLSEEQWVAMRRHPEVGAGILASNDFDDIRSWVLAHHEQPDGKGYPLGLPGDQIPLEAQILGVADAYEAMTSGRSYRDPIGPEAARKELRRCAGTQFDEGVVDAFLRGLEREEMRMGRRTRT